VTAYNNHDAKAYAALLTENYEDWEVDDLKGRVDAEERLTKLFARQKDVQARMLGEIDIIFVTPEVAIVKVHAELTGKLDEDGKPLLLLKRLVTLVFVKKNGKWLRAARFARSIEE